MSRHHVAKHALSDPIQLGAHNPHLRVAVYSTWQPESRAESDIIGRNMTCRVSVSRTRKWREPGVPGTVETPGTRVAPYQSPSADGTHIATEAHS